MRHFTVGNAVVPAYIKDPPQAPFMSDERKLKTLVFGMMDGNIHTKNG